MKTPTMRIPLIDYKTHPAYQYKPTLGDRYKALRMFMPWFLEGLRQRVRIRPSICTDGCDLGREGVVGYHLPSETIARLARHAQPYINQILKSKQQRGVSIFKEKVLQVSERKSPKFFAFVNNLLKEYQIIERAEHYRGYPLYLTKLAVQVGDPEDSDWRDHFSDVGVKDPPTAYFHIDGSIGDMKAVAYLTEVGEENGPFQYIRGSNYVLSTFENAVRYGNDKTKLDSCDANHRKLFAALPRMLQKKSEFGNDIQTGFDDLTKNEYHFLSARDGNLLLFDNNGLHRGGMVTTGRRIILQMNFRPVTNGGHRQVVSSYITTKK